MSQFDPRFHQGSMPPPKPYPQQANFPTQSNGKAIASLVLGGLSFFLSVVTGIPAIIFGILGLRDARNSQGRVGGQGLAIAGITLGSIGSLSLLAALLLVIPLLKEEAARADHARNSARSSNHLKQIGLGMHNYHDVYKTFPHAGSIDVKNGFELSWRVRLTPFIEEGPIFDRVQWDQPWDSPSNKQIINPMPDTFKVPGFDSDGTQTLYLGVVGPDDPNRPGFNGTVFNHKLQQIRMASITDGTSNTIMVVEADEDQAVTWTQPADWNYDPQNPRRGLGNYRNDLFLSLFCDGSVHRINNKVEDETLRRLFERADGLPFQNDF